MPLPFIVAGIAAVAGAVGTAGAVAGTAAVAAAGTVAAAAGTAAAVAGTALLTVGGISITVGGVAAAATAFGIASKVFEDTHSYSTEYISDSEKTREQEKLRTQLIEEKNNFQNLIFKETSNELKNEMREVLEQAKELEENVEYFKAINVINSYKLVYAKKKTDEKLAKKAEETALLLIKVRKQTLELRG